jgi:hypothetical protein
VALEPPPTETLHGARRLVACIAMFQVTCFGWLLFRARNVAQVGTFLKAIFTHFTLDSQAVSLLAPLLLFGGMLWAVDGWVRNADDPTTRPGWSLGLGSAVCTTALVLMLVLAPPGNHQFIYFQF